MNIFETDRLFLHRLTSKDAPFILKLVNDPSWIKYIGDKNIKTLKAAREYIKTGPQKSYALLGFGLYAVHLKTTGKSIGICGLLRRDTLDDADIGFAFLPEYTGKGYASESAEAVIKHARHILGMKRILAITSPDNFKSIKLLEKLGFEFIKKTKLSADAGEVSLFEIVYRNK